MRLTPLFFLVPGLLGAATKEPAANVDELFGTSAAKAVVAQPDSLEICLLLPASGSWESPPRAYGEYREGTVRPVPDEKKQELISILVDDATYKWAKVVISAEQIRITKKGCAPVYHIRVKARKGTDTVDVSFCYYCSDALLAFNGEPINGAGLGARSLELLGLLRSVFPEDELLSKAQEFLVQRTKLINGQSQHR